jgi:DNA polymerase-3 subunit gamma/tau
MAAPGDVLVPSPQSFEAVAEMAGQKRDADLKYQVETQAHLVRFERGRIELRPTERARPTLASELATKLSKWTGERWVVSISNAAGAPTLAERKRDADAAAKAEIRSHPLVAEVLSLFPGADLVDIRETAPDPVPPPILRASDEDGIGDGDDDALDLLGLDGPSDPYADEEEGE